jgi:hypothetical protein
MKGFFGLPQNDKRNVFVQEFKENDFMRFKRVISNYSEINRA